MKINGKTAVILAGIILPLFSSCRHKDLYMEDSMTSRLEVVFDWRNAPEADPSSMALYLYDEDGTSPMRFIFSNKTGGEIKAPFGMHNAICMNADNTNWARMRNKDNISTMEILTLDAESLSAQRIGTRSVPRAEGTEDERIAQTPGMLWGSRENNIGIYPHSGTQTITMYPVEAVCHYTVDVYDVENLDKASSGSVDATLSGMAEGYCHGTESATDNHVSMAFTLNSDGSHNSLHGEFLTFGECPSLNLKHYLTIYTVLSDGSGWYKSFDVTDQVANAPDPRHVHIVVRGLPLPEPPSDGGTKLSADVNEWQEVNISLQM